jgi:hypothetical protein
MQTVEFVASVHQRSRRLPLMRQCDTAVWGEQLQNATQVSLDRLLDCSVFDYNSGTDSIRISALVFLDCQCARLHGGRRVRPPVCDRGKDYGEVLYTMGILGWLRLATIPLGMIAGVVWLIALVLHHSAWKRRHLVGVPPAIENGMPKN